MATFQYLVKDFYMLIHLTFYKCCNICFFRSRKSNESSWFLSIWLVYCHFFLIYLNSKSFNTEAELASIGKSSKTKIDFNEFLNILSRNMADNRIEKNQMIEAFKMFDVYGIIFENILDHKKKIKINKILGNGLVNLMQMRTALQNLGERLKVI